MLFNSFEFIVFLPLVLLAFRFAGNLRWLVLLIASYVFYMSWNWQYLFLIVFSTLVDYFCARGMAGSIRPAGRKAYLLTSIISNLSLLFTFKYFDFFSRSIAQVSGHSEALTLELLLPVGISFYTFQTLSYSIDVYHGRASVEKHLGRFALFVSFFPQLVAGPIERAPKLLRQLRENLMFKRRNIMPAAKLILWGLFKKVVVADRVAMLVDPVYADPASFSGGMLLLATVLFAVQIYCDFSGYVDMALGIARLFNVRLSQNFRTPYFSASITEFWRRWHITLSTWFRDYVYIPMGGRHAVKWRHGYHLMLTFLVSGLWHGANWTFIAWGGLHGLLIIAEKYGPKLSLSRWLRVPLTFALVCFGWILFRSASMEAAFTLIRGLGSWGSMDADWQHLYQGGLYKVYVVLAIGMSGMLFLFELLADKGYNPKPLVQVAFYLFLVFSIILFSAGESAPFIYFQF